MKSKSLLKKYILRILALALIASVFFVGFRLFRYVAYDDTIIEQLQARAMLGELYASEENIDILFVGSSHSYANIVPTLADEAFGAYTFNAGTASQTIDGSLAIIKDAIAGNDIDTIYLEMYYVLASYEEFEERTSLTDVYMVADYLQNPLTRASLLLKASSSDYYINSFIVARRAWESLTDISVMLDVVAAKQEASYTDTAGYIDSRGREYVGRGYMAYHSVYEPNGFSPEPTTGIDIDALSDDWYDTLDAIVSLCEKNDINLVLWIAPIPFNRAMTKYNYTEYAAHIESLADGYGIAFYDFNAMRSTYFDTSDYSLFGDDNHLNVEGSALFTELFAGVMQGEIAEKDIFYTSFDERLADEGYRLVGVSAIDHDASIVMTDTHTGYEYQVTYISESETYILKEYAEDVWFQIPGGSGFTLRIEAKDPETGEVVDTLDAYYTQ